MWLLWLVTAVWAFSFSLIDVYLAGRVDSYLAVFIRVSLAFLLFLPLLRPSRFAPFQMLALTGIGAIQLGVTYLLLYHAFLYLEVAELLLFTIFTPLYITLIDDFLIQRRRLPARWWLAALVAVLGAAVIRYDRVSPDAWIGFLLIQGANFSFAAGQVFYKRLPLGDLKQQSQVFGFFFLGASLVAGLGSLVFGNWQKLPGDGLTWGILIWLGLGASGLGYMGWNYAAKRVNTGQLAAMNNMLIPTGILVNFLFWNRDVDWLRLLVGGVIILLSLRLCQPSPGSGPDTRVQARPKAEAAQ